MKKKVVILCTAVLLGCQQAEQGGEGSGTIMDEPSGAEQPTTGGLNNDASNADGNSASQTNGADDSTTP